MHATIEDRTRTRPTKTRELEEHATLGAEPARRAASSARHRNSAADAASSNLISPQRADNSSMLSTVAVVPVGVPAGDGNNAPVAAP